MKKPKNVRNFVLLLYFQQARCKLIKVLNHFQPIFEEVVVDLVEEFARLGKALKWKIYYFIGFSAQASTLGVFFI